MLRSLVHSLQRDDGHIVVLRRSASKGLHFGDEVVDERSGGQVLGGSLARWLPQYARNRRSLRFRCRLR